ncbi:MAG: insulinase family protein, partial [Anaerolineaceae bacterium]|nr:insulinase family protein [Anaerolineaceae bacterium]
LSLSYRAPDANQPDFFTLTILDSLLSGPSSLNMFGGGSISNKTSRLYRALVEQGLAVAASGGMRATTHPFLYDLNLVLPPGSDPEPALQAVDEQIQRLQNERVSQDDIQRALKQARALFAYGSENISNQGFWMGYANMFGKYDWFLNYVSELEKVTPEMILQAAQTWLNPARRVVGIYLPENGTGAA